MDTFYSRKNIIQALFIFIAVAFGARLFYLQVVDETYKERANINVVRKLTVYPARGLVYDRNGKLVVYNQATYDIMAIPSQTGKFDTVKLCSLLQVEPDAFKASFNKAVRYSRFKPSIIVGQVPPETYATFQEHLHEFNGFYRQLRTVRKYPYQVAAHSLGYTGEINPEELKQKKDYYQLGDYIGISGIEKSYEEQLRGKRGVKRVLVDALNRVQGPFRNKTFDTLAVAGRDLTLSLDIDLQQYGEDLIRNKKGSIVAIEPKTGEILVMVTSPSYDPNLLTGKQRGKTIKALSQDTLKPLYNRAIQADQYPPGSTFKPLMALMSLQEGILTPEQTYACHGGYHLPGLTVGCLSPGTFNMRTAIQRSCNAYFCNAYKLLIEQPRFNNAAEGFDNFRKHLLSFGLGQPVGVDIPNEAKGSLPSVALYDKMYGAGRWKASTTISLGIGQGELGVTPLQLANYFAALANRGWYYTPHLVKFIEGDTTDYLAPFRVKHHTSIDPKYFPIVIDGMEQVVLAGSGRVARIPHIPICGKTGTAENPLGEDHSFFAAFAPKEDPQIAIMVIVENSGFGSRYAAPIASLLIEKYLTDSISTPRQYLETRMLEANLTAPPKPPLP